MSEKQTRRIVEGLWPEGDAPDAPQVYAVLDGARDPRIESMIRRSRREYECLYRGQLTKSLQQAAPYVVHLARDGRFTKDLLDRGWGRSWGFFTRVPPDFSAKQHLRHFRGLLRVQDESGRKLVFRFYDPRVLRVYLPTCTADEAKQFFGPVPRILVESEDAEALLTLRPGPGGVDAEELSL